MKQGLVRLLYNLGKVHGVDITHDNVCSSIYPVSIRIYYQQGVLFLVSDGFVLFLCQQNVIFVLAALYL